MRVLLASASSGSRGGGEIYLKALAQGLLELGHEVVAALSDRPHMDELAADMPDGCELERLPITNTYLRRSRSFGSVLDRAGQRLLTREFERIAPDVIHLNKQNLEDGLDLLQAAKASTLPSVATVHVPRSMSNLKAKWGGLRDTLSRHVICRQQVPLIAISPQCTRELRSFLGRHSSLPVYNVTNGAFPCTGDRDTYRGEWQAGPDDVLLGTLARIEPQKNPLFLIRVLSELPAQVKLVWIGDGTLRADLEKEIERYGVADRVILDGWRTDGRERLAGLDLFVLPSLYEGLPLAILEAMSAGVPAVVSDVDGTRDAVNHGRNGYLLEVNNHSEWRECLETLAVQPALRKSLGQQARQDYEQSFSLRAMAEQTARVYETILSHRTLPEPVA